MPCISIELPTSITRYNMRGTRRIKLEPQPEIHLKKDNQNYSAKIIDVSPTGFLLKLDQIPDVSLLGRNTLSIDGNHFDVLLSPGINNGYIAKAITEEPNHFGKYFDFYARFAYPNLISRYTFKDDPIPFLLEKTGQAKRHASKENPETWWSKIKDAYLCSKDVLHSHFAQYVAVDQDGNPIGTSALANAFIDVHENPIWVFHGLGTSQDPKHLDITGTLYKWRIDYLMCKGDKLRVAMWFDGRGRWLEKVYIKFSKLTTEDTRIWPIRHNRYEKVEDSNKKIELKENYKIKKVSIGAFERSMVAESKFCAGFGVTYLNYSGILNNIFFNDPNDSAVDAQDLDSIVQNLQPNIFFLETPTDQADYEFDGYSMSFIDAANRQCFTNSVALRFFTSSLEHSKAIVRKKYG